MLRWHFMPIPIAALAALAFATTAAAVDPPRITWTPMTFQTREGPSRKVDAEQGWLTVREDWSDTTSATIELGVVRFRCTGKLPGAPIVYLAGGPGGSGTRSAAGDRFPLFMAMREAADVIALDQRGVLSKPFAACREPRGYPLDRAMDRDTLLRVLRERCRRCAQQWAGEHVNLAAYTTEASAEDIEALRQALGVPKISLWAISYGTHLGLSMLRRHPEGVERAILAGVEGPDHTLKLPGTLQRQLEMIDSLIRTDPTARRLTPDFLGGLGSVLDRLHRQPVTVEIQDPRTKEPIQMTVGALDLQIVAGEQISERSDIARIPARLRAMMDGDFRGLAAAAVGFRMNPLGPAMAFSMDCASGVSPERRERIRREAPQALLGDAINLPYMEICDVWPHRDLGPAFRAPVTCAVPTLFISGTLDARTPVANAEEVAQGFSRATQLVIDGAGHDDDLLLSSPKIVEDMLAFLAGRPLPAPRIALPPIRFSRQP